MAINDIITLVLLVLGFLVALLTYVSTIALKPRLALIVGLKMHLHYTRDKRLIVTMDFVFLNGGAQPGVLIDLSGTISPEEKESPTAPAIRWEKFEETQNIAPPGTPSRYYTRSAGFVHPLILPGRAAEAGGLDKTIRLFTEAPFTLEDKPYFLALTALEASTLKKARIQCCLHLEPGNADYLLRYGVEDEEGRFEKQLSLTRVIHSQKTFGWSVLRKPPAIDFISQKQKPAP
jgi:hypothetical protein